MSTPKPTYYDACSLAYQAEGRPAGCVTMAADVGPMVDAMMADPNRVNYTSDLAIHEFRSTIAKLGRNPSQTTKHLDAAWMQASVTDLMERILSQQMTVMNTEPAAYPQASALVDMAARDGRAFGLWDTVHILNATALSVEIGECVDLVTADTGFERFLEYRPHFASAVSVVTLRDPHPESRPAGYSPVAAPVSGFCSACGRALSNVD